MNEFIKIGLGLLLLFIICFTISSIYNKRQENRIKQRIKEEYGDRINIDDVTYDIKRISTYSNNKASKGTIDEITWTDLDMDNIFKIINNTQSSAGAEVLYDILKTPLYNKQNLQKRNMIIRFLQENKDIRFKLQLILSKLGQSYEINATESIFEGFENSKSKLHLYRFLSILPIIFLILIIIDKKFVILALLSVYFNVSLSMRNKAKQVNTRAYTYLIKCINTANKISSMKLDMIDNNIMNIKEDLNKVKKLNKKVLSTDAYALISDINALSEYMDTIFLGNLINYERVTETIGKYKYNLQNIYRYVGEIDAWISVASFRDSLDKYALPDLYDGSENKEIVLNFEDIYHPLIQNPVLNSLKVKKDVLVTGSNASGKSTFLKVVAINAVLAQTIYTTCAKKYASSIFNIYTSMALKDDILMNESYYIVEIKSLKRIIDNSNSELPCLCFIDEVLRGTNTVERIACSSEVLRYLSKKNCICFAATHDIELTYLLDDCFENYHFEERITDNDIEFDYKLRNGRATSRNAINLLKFMGYEDDIVKKSQNRAEYFVNTGKWIK